jgi:threonine/homoserine/homoserine lactone efflux protein
VAFGLVLGAATGIPLGVVNVAVVEAATRAGRRAGAAIGAGGALADGVHAALAFAGLAPLLDRYERVRLALLALSAVVVIAYAAVVWRRPPLILSEPREAGRVEGRFLLGVSLTLPNPAALAAWVAVAGMLPSHSLGAAVGAAIGVAVGSAAWFVLLAHLAARRSLEGAGARRLSRILALALVSLAAFAILRELL